MKTSCGIIIVNEFKEIFVGHSTGNKFFDIPKGTIEENESHIECAIRECDEETSLLFKPEELTDLGFFPYNKDKQLYLFLTFKNKSEIDLPSLVCRSTFEHYYTKKTLPEVDYFSWVSFDEIEQKFAKSMTKLLLNLVKNGTIYSNSVTPKCK